MSDTLTSAVDAAVGPSLLPVSAVEERLHVSRSKAYELILAGAIESVRLGPRSIRVVSTALDNYIAGLPSGMAPRS